MGNIISSITQLKDLAFSFDISMIDTPLQIIKAFVNNERIKTADIGVREIAYEFSDGKKLEKGLSNLFNILGFM